MMDEGRDDGGAESSSAVSMSRTSLGYTNVQVVCRFRPQNELEIRTEAGKSWWAPPLLTASPPLGVIC
jgi:hypothetical protein